MESLSTPWRFDYVSSAAMKSDECFLCSAARSPQEPDSLVVHGGRFHLILLNRFPYASGHLMVAPLEHWREPGQAPAAAQRELWSLVLTSQGVLQQVYEPEGFNLGMNLGSAAGAGVADHYHFHVVPRWRGDTNFMTAVGSVRVVPEDVRTAWRRLRQRFAALPEPGSEECE
ncbi:MAG: HIT domain-containing protein [Acidobacteriota bacterium]